MNPNDRITAYLTVNKSRIECLTMEMVIQDVKQFVFYGLSPLSNEEIRIVVARWAMIWAVGLLIKTPATSTVPLPSPSPSPSSATSESEIITAIKKAISTVGAGITIGKEGANFNLGVSGPTANLKKGDSAASLGISWSGSLKLDANSGPFYFSGSLSKEKWEITLSFPQDTYIPNLATLGKVFTEGERAVVRLAQDASRLSNITDVQKIGALVKPNAEAIQGAVEAVSGIAKAKREGGPSFGFKLGSPDPSPGEQGIPSGIQATAVFSYVF